MFGRKQFQAIRYKRPNIKARKSQIGSFVGLDSEAYSDGRPFMFCTSLKDIILPEDIPEKLFDEKFDGKHFVLFNMKYDSGAMLQCFLNPQEIRKLARYQEVSTCDGYKISYLPHKHLSISQGKITRDFWDIAQYYHTSLEKASRKYLGAGKTKIETKRFSRRYVKKHWKRLCRYCIKDSILTARLAEYFKEKLNDFGVQVHSLYSPASLAFTFFTTRLGGVVDIFDVWDRHPDAVQFAHEAYQGGKFECTSRGTFYGYEYDIVSAYPYQMRNLIDIREASWIRSKTPIDGAPYSWYRAKIRHHDTKVPPCHGLLLKGVRVYCQGEYEAFLTSNELEYLIENNIGVSILDGWHCVPTYTSYPYRDTIDYLFDLKDQYKGKDAMLYSICKLMMNSYYGRMANLNERHEEPEANCVLPIDKFGEVSVFDAGSAWNPFYASMITANTRIMICKLQKYLGAECLAVHTDSVICTKPLPDNFLSSDLGGLEKKMEGEGLLVMSGLYDMCGHTACRGIEMKNGFTWKRLLLTKPNGWKYRYPQVRAISWTQAAAWDRLHEINLFESMPKWININSDVKRDWGKIIRGKDLLHRINNSTMRRVDL